MVVDEWLISRLSQGEFSHRSYPRRIPNKILPIAMLMKSLSDNLFVKRFHPCCCKSGWMSFQLIRVVSVYYLYLELESPFEGHDSEPKTEIPEINQDFKFLDVFNFLDVFKIHQGNY